MKRGEPATAKKLFRKTIRTDWEGTQAAPYVGLAWLAMNNKNYPLAEKNFRQGKWIDSKCFFCYDGLARLALIHDKPKEALEWATEGAEIVRHNQDLINLLDTILVRINTLAVSLETYGDLVERYPDDAIYRTRLGNTLILAGRMQEARAQFTQALAKQPFDTAASRGLARIDQTWRSIAPAAWSHYYAGQYSQALTGFEAQRAEARRLGNPTVEEGRGWTLVALGRPAEGLTAFREADTILPGHLKAKYGERLAFRLQQKPYGPAWAAMSAGRYQEAAAMFRKLAASLETAGLAHEGLGWVAFNQKQTQKAEKAFSTALDYSLDAYMAALGFGRISLDKKDYGAAENLLLHAFNTYPLLGEYNYTETAGRLLKAGRATAARRILAVGEQAYPKSGQIQMQLALAEQQLGTDQVLERVMIALELDARAAHDAFYALELSSPDALTVHYALAWKLYLSGDNANALHHFDAYIRQGGTELNAKRGRGFALYRLQRYGEAILDLMEASKGEPDKLKVLNEYIAIPGTAKKSLVVYNATTTLAWTYLKIEAPRQAEEVFRRALRILPKWLDPQTGLGWALLAQGRKQEARQAFNKALEWAPGYADALNGLKVLEGGA